MTSPYRAVILASVLAVCVAGCGSQGPAEKTGEAVDKAAHETVEGAKKAADKTGEAAHKAEDKVEDAAK